LADIAFGLATLDAAGDRAALRFRLKDEVARDCLVIRFADFDLVLSAAIWVSLMSTTASNAATDTSPAIGRGTKEPGVYARDSLFNSEAVSCNRPASYCSAMAVTLLMQLKSSEFGAILWLILCHSDHELAAAQRVP
jgi:hypothetical protein